MMRSLPIKVVGPFTDHPSGFSSHLERSPIFIVLTTSISIIVLSISNISSSLSLKVKKVKKLGSIPFFPAF